MNLTRALIAFAYVADRFSKTNDIAQGLVPLFAPLISARAGTLFDAEVFAKDVKNSYDIEMHPYVAEEFAAMLAKVGYLEEDRRGNVVQYTNLKRELPDPPVREEQLQALVGGFGAFAGPRLERIGSTLTPDKIEEAFIDRLVRPEFLALLLRPDNPVLGSKTLTLKPAEAPDNSEFSATDQHLDYLVARYILHLHEANSVEFDVLVAATSGALVSEVVLDLQHPLTDTQVLSGIRVAVDSPLLLDALDLGIEGAMSYAKQLIEQIRGSGAIPVVYETTIDEIRRVLSATLRTHDRREETYGPLARRLRYSVTLAPYVRAIIPEIDSHIISLGVELCEFSKVDRARRLQYFTEVSENELGDSLGQYPTEDARKHDAQAVADVLRIRGKRQIKSIRDAIFVFVTRNLRLVRLTRRFLDERSMVSSDYFPPCISDRYLAGLLWITCGGGGDSLPRLRLIANCSAAVVPRRQLVARMHSFFRDLKPSMAERFEALMTNERAEHFLMDRTLSDATLISSENYEEIYQEIEEAAAEKVLARKNEEIARLRQDHEGAEERIAASKDAEIVSLRQNHEQEINKLSERMMQIGVAAQTKQERTAVLTQKNEELEEDLETSERQWAMACLRAGLRTARNIWIGTILFCAFLTTIDYYYGEPGSNAFLVFGMITFLVAAIRPLIGGRYWRDNPLDRWIAERRHKAAVAYARKHDVEEILCKFTLDWTKQTVTRNSE